MMRNALGGNGRLDQICGWDDAERPVDCAQSWSKWSEVCACEDDLCNTFAFLRNSIDSRTLLNRDDQDNGGIYLPIDNDDRYSDTYNTRGNRRDWLQSNNLIILLVIVPLAVGALAVCLVFLNYHCKMS
ncbi:hypothetical protein DdX_07890 [Ditylenchus destructor]|uniref:Uncharacterized protein n=1 Tax=Ditylenchus destructor TaxID=166010 RepID=A0AAD4R7Q1_9BILA|nr:hypothetical protein DdX_07890 [Ditylenchus destructor]